MLTLYFDRGAVMPLFGCIQYGRKLVVWTLKAIKAFVSFVISNEHDIWLLSLKGKLSSSGLIPIISSSEQGLSCRKKTRHTATMRCVVPIIDLHDYRKQSKAT
jgi:hypothetical protein